MAIWILSTKTCYISLDGEAGDIVTKCSVAPRDMKERLNEDASAHSRP